MTEHMWGSGDYKSVAGRIASIGDVLGQRAGIKPGMEVLDVACGAGNATIPAAKLGARHLPGTLAVEYVTRAMRAASPGDEFREVRRSKSMPRH
jgi:cyclopropane fatty-acyl-phospholipid synthase-like methyltransferase